LTKAATVTVADSSLRLGLALPLLVTQCVRAAPGLLLPLAPFPALILTAA